jgi:hypothetical protein
MNTDFTKEQRERITIALENLIHGGRQPMGIEALVMAVCGKNGPGESNVADSLQAVADRISDKIEDVASSNANIASALYQVAESLNNIAEAIHPISGKLGKQPDE